MAGKVSADGKTVDFEFLDISGNLQYGHMQHAAFTFIDATHHTEDWTYMRTATSRCAVTSSCSVQNDASGCARSKVIRKPGWTVNGTIVNRFTASFGTGWSR